MKNNNKKEKNEKTSRRELLQEVTKNTRKDETKNQRSLHEVNELFLNTSTKITIRR